MSLENLSHEEIENMSLIELAKLVLLAEKRPLKFTEAFDKVSELKGLSEAQKQDKISQFYTDLNVDGNFVMNGANTWGLKRWYRVQKETEAAATTTTPRRTRKSQVIDVDEIDVDTDEFEMLDENIDHIDRDDLDDDFDEEEELGTNFSESFDDKDDFEDEN